MILKRKPEMKNISLTTFFLCIILFSSVFGQEKLYYYGYNTKYQLKTDSVNAILIPQLGKFTRPLDELAIEPQIVDLMPIVNRQEILAKLDDKTLFTKGISGYDVLPVFYVGDQPLWPTGEIVFKPKKDIEFDKIKQLFPKHFTLVRKKKHGVYVIKPTAIQSLIKTANLIYESNLVEWCEPNFLIEIEKQQLEHSTDPLFPQQFYLHQTNNIDINAPQAWNITTRSCPIRVAVIDDGVENHEDLTGRVLSGFTPLNPIGYGAPVYNLPPTNEGIIGHGQACAGIIGASHNSLGIAGVFPAAEIVPVNIFYSWFLDPNAPIGSRLRWLETAENLADAINWAWDTGEAKVLSNSWGYHTTNPDNINESGQIIQAIYNARTLGRNGLGSIVVFASGNSHQSFSGVTFPANVDGVLTVGAIDRDGNIWSYSSRGNQLDLVAPSGDTNSNGDVTTTDRMGNLGYSSGNYTTQFGGTSGAAPQVAGVVAMILSENPLLTEAEIRVILQNTATDMGTAGFDQTFGYGLIDAYAALQAVIPEIIGPDFICDPSVYTISNLPTGATVSWSIPAPYSIVGSSTGTSVTVQSSANLGGTLTAVITTDCGEYTLTKYLNRKELEIVMQPGMPCGDAAVIADVGSNPGTYTWTVTGDLAINGGGQTLVTSSNIIQVSGLTGGNISVSITGACPYTISMEEVYVPYREAQIGSHNNFPMMQGDPLTAFVEDYEREGSVLTYRWILNDNLIHSESSPEYNSNEDGGAWALECGMNLLVVEALMDCGTTVKVGQMEFERMCE